MMVSFEAVGGGGRRRPGAWRCWPSSSDDRVPRRAAGRWREGGVIRAPPCSQSGTSADRPRRSGDVAVGQSHIPRHIPRRKPLKSRRIWGCGGCGECFSGLSYRVRARAHVCKGWNHIPHIPHIPRSLRFQRVEPGDVLLRHPPFRPTFPGRRAGGPRRPSIRGHDAGAIGRNCARRRPSGCEPEPSRGRRCGRACRRSPCRRRCVGHARSRRRSEAAARRCRRSDRGRRRRPRRCRTGPTRRATNPLQAAPSLSDASIISSRLPRKPSMPATSSTPPRTCAQFS